MQRHCTASGVCVCVCASIHEQFSKPNVGLVCSGHGCQHASSYPLFLVAVYGLLPQMLANPKEHVQQVTMLFERLVETTLGVTKEEMSQPVFAGLSCLTYPELHDVRDQCGCCRRYRL